MSQVSKHSVELAEMVVEAEIFPAVLSSLRDPDDYVVKNVATLIREIAKHSPEVSLVDQTTPSAALDVLHHQHTEGGSGHSGRAFVTQRNAYNWEMHITACSVVTSVG